MRKIKIFIIVVSAFIGISIGVPLFYFQGCKIEYNKSSLRSIETALKLFYLDTGRYPTNEEGLNILLHKNEVNKIPGYRAGGYVERLQNDRWGNPFHYYKYKLNSGEEIINIWSFGSDSLPGGDGENKDINHIIRLTNS